MPAILRLERADLQIEGHQRLEEAVVEEQINEILLLPQREPVLAADEAEAVAEFEDEGLQPGDEPVFEFALLHGAADAEEFEVVGAFEHLVRLLGKMLRQGEGEIVGFLLRDGAFVSAGLDLVEQDIARPAEAGGGAEIPEAGGGVGELASGLQRVVPRELLRQAVAEMLVSQQFGHRLWPIRLPGSILEQLVPEFG